MSTIFSLKVPFTYTKTRKFPPTEHIHITIIFILPTVALKHLSKRSKEVREVLQ